LCCFLALRQGKPVIRCARFLSCSWLREGEQREDSARLLEQKTRYCSVIDKRSAVHIRVFLFALSSGADMEWLLAAAQEVVTVFVTTVSEPSWQSAAVAVVVLLVLSA